MVTTKTHLIATNSQMIDPINAGSTVSYVVTRYGSRVSGELHISDCDRKVKWYFGRHTSSAKLDKAIAMLEEFKANLEKAKAEAPKPRIKKKTVKRAGTT